MNILVFGAGVIGTIYGYALSQAGNRVTHFVRPGKKTQFEDGIDIHLLDGRFKPAKHVNAHYCLEAVEDFKPARKIFETHTAIDELQAMYHDLLTSGLELGIDMPHYLSLKAYVETPAVYRGN
jgi:pyruvate/2-oxoglutarate dehydrogenase complex dihydrolipoamide dehydrogenase (E3) component